MKSVFVGECETMKDAKKLKAKIVKLGFIPYLFDYKGKYTFKVFSSHSDESIEVVANILRRENLTVFIR